MIVKNLSERNMKMFYTLFILMLLMLLQLYRTYLLLISILENYYLYRPNTIFYPIRFSCFHVAFLSALWFLLYII